MNIEWLKSLIKLVEDSDIDSLEVERFTTRVRIRKSPQMTAAPVLSSSPPRTDIAIPMAAGAAGETAPADGTIEVFSPMVGTFYRAAAPDAPPFVSVGDRIEKGQTLCILEAMKLMNELEAEVNGIVREIAVENADPVEYGALLFRVEPS